MRVFISSVMKSISVGGKVFKEMEGDRQAAREAVLAMGFEPVTYEHLPPSDRIGCPVYLDELGRSDLAVFLFWQTITSPVKKEYDVATRLGIPRLVFIKKCYEGEERSKELSEYLQDRVRPKDTGVKYSKYRTFTELAELIRTAIVTHVTNSIRNSTYVAPTSQNLYSTAATIAESSRHRLSLCQDSLTGILPVKTTNDSERDKAERRLCTTIRKWIECIRNNTPCTLLLLGAVDKTLWEFRRLCPDGRNYVVSSMSELAQLESEFPQCFRLGWVESYRKDMYVSSAGERRYGCYVRNPLTGDPVAGFVGSNEKLADAIFSYVDRTILKSKISTGHVLGKLREIEEDEQEHLG